MVKDFKSNKEIHTKVSGVSIDDKKKSSLTKAWFYSLLKTSQPHLCNDHKHARIN